MASDRQLDFEPAAAAGLQLDGIERSHPHPSHAQIGVILARDRLAVQDEEILQDIENHTLGRPEMSRSSCIIFVADSIDPGRGNTSELEEWQLISWENLARAVWQTCDYSITGQF